MLGIALKMLFGDPAKLAGLIAGIAFSTLLMAQQGGFFISLIARAANSITDAADVDVWVIDPRTETAEGPTSMRHVELYRVRGVRGVASAHPLVRASATVRTSDRRSNTAAFIGVDEASLKGITSRFIAGTAQDLRQPDAIAIDQLGFSQLWPGEPLVPGKTLEINDRRAVVTAITDALPGFTTPIVIYTRINQAIEYVPGGRNRLSAILVKTEAREVPAVVADRIASQTKLLALTRAEFQRRSINFVLANTGIAPSFGVVIALGAVVGIIVSGLTFALFVNDNLRQFAVLKAVGVSNARLLGVVLAQALVVAFIGFSFGLFLACVFFDLVNTPLSDLKGFWLPWQIAAMTAVAVIAIAVIASLASIRRVLSLDPATVFRS